MNGITGCARPFSAVATWTWPSWNSSCARSRRENRPPRLMRTPSTPAAALDAMSSTSSTRMSSPGKKRANRSASSGTTSAAVYTSSSSGLGIGARPATPSTTCVKCSRQIEVGGLAIGRQAGGPAVELDGVMIEVARPDRRQHARRGRERVAGVAQERLDRVVARHRRLELAEPDAGVGDVRRDVVLGPRQLAPLAGEERPLDRLAPGQHAQHADRAAAPPGSAPRRRAGARWCAARASSPPRSRSRRACRAAPRR